MEINWVTLITDALQWLFIFILWYRISETKSDVECQYKMRAGSIIDIQAKLPYGNVPSELDILQLKSRLDALEHWRSYEKGKNDADKEARDALS